jgi:hypothetical protein
MIRELIDMELEAVAGGWEWHAPGWEWHAPTPNTISLSQTNGVSPTATASRDGSSVGFGSFVGF